MREGPSEPVYRDRLQTALSCFPQRREVVSVKEKVPQDGIR
jgi:response regulator of citrate/malate metabolism